jgi:hypothetical protein
MKHTKLVDVYGNICWENLFKKYEKGLSLAKNSSSNGLTYIKRRHVLAGVCFINLFASCSPPSPFCPALGPTVLHVYNSEHKYPFFRVGVWVYQVTPLPVGLDV